jgi:RHS repeat-associated protein
VYGLELLYTVENGAPHYVHTDGVGSVIQGTDAAGHQEARVEYDPFGAFGSASWSHWPTRLFAGEETDSTNGSVSESIVYLRARYYDPFIGRFISSDPLGGSTDDTQSLNAYAYCENDPVGHIDPSGDIPIPVILAGAGAIGGILNQGLSDAITGQFSGPRAYVAAAVGGAVTGFTLPWLLANSGPLAPAFAGGLGGAVSNVIKQAGSHQFNVKSLIRDVGVNALATSVGPLEFTGVKGSAFVVSKTLATKFNNGLIYNVTAASSAKLLYGQTIQQFYQWTAGGVLDAVIRTFTQY